VVGNTVAFARDQLGFITDVARKYGDVARFEVGGTQVYQLGDPDLVAHVLVHENENYVKGDRFNQILRPIVGNGLLTNEGAFWREQRHRVQPAFHPSMLERYAEVMTAYTERLLDSWRDGEPRDVHADMMHLTVEIAAKALFDVDIREMEAEIGTALEAAMDHAELDAHLPFDVPAWLPTPENRRFQRALADLDAVAARILDEHRARAARGEDGDDVVSRLLAARDDAGTPLSDQQIRDEIVTLLLAGHETTALTLTYTLHLLGRHPDVEATLHEEVDAVLDGRTPTVADLDDLTYTERVVKEELRIYPPVWELIREAVTDDQVGDYHVPAGTTVAVQPWVLHRDPRYFEEPEAFRPERWTTAFERELPPFAYFPFGGGPRRCIGDRFARLEARLVLATVARDWRLEPVADELSFSPSITLRPDGPVEMVPRRRQR